jgi:hypothetical protein
VKRFEFKSRADFTTEFVQEHLDTFYRRCFGVPTWTNFCYDVMEKPNLQGVFVEVDGAPVGFRIGYDIGVNAWHSWLTGVVIERWRYGIAAEMVASMNDHLRETGYQRVTMNSSPAMLGVYGKLGINVRQRHPGHAYQLFT